MIQPRREVETEEEEETKGEEEEEEVTTLDIVQFPDLLLNLRRAINKSSQDYRSSRDDCRLVMVCRAPQTQRVRIISGSCHFT